MYRKPPRQLRNNGNFATERSPLLIAKYRRGHGNFYNNRPRAVRAARTLHPPTPTVYYRPGVERAQSPDGVTPVPNTTGRDGARTSHVTQKSIDQANTMRDLDLSEETMPFYMESTAQSSKGKLRREQNRPTESTGDEGQRLEDVTKNVVSPVLQKRRKKLLRPNPSTTRRGSSMLLLGVGAFFAFQQLPQPHRDLTLMRKPTTVLSTTTTPRSDLNDLPQATTMITTPRHPIMVHLPMGTMPSHRRRRHRRPPLKLSQLVGRISAWLCTLLYMTSRLPQIWTNFQRRSVKGLSLFLFVSAFTANVLYCVNILSSPKAVGLERRAFLTESMPFLLGSAGTLLFDLVVIVQWYMWHERPHAH